MRPKELLAVLGLAAAVLVAGWTIQYAWNGQEALTATTQTGPVISAPQPAAQSVHQATVPSAIGDPQARGQFPDPNHPPTGVDPQLWRKAMSPPSRALSPEELPKKLAIHPPRNPEIYNILEKEALIY